jgi:GNAT superfamily N-acetyltransferase
MCRYAIQNWNLISRDVSNLRLAVWKPLAEPNARGLELTELIESLDIDTRSVHFVCYRNEMLVGAVRLTLDYLSESITRRLGIQDPAGSALVTRLVVDPAYRNHGFAKQLEMECIKHAIDAGQQWLWAEAAPTTAAALLRLGFESLLTYKEEGEAIFVRQELTIVRKLLRDFTPL